MEGGAMTSKADYRRYLQSPEWWARRARRLEVAGHQCEFREYVADHKGYYRKRCTATADLQVHHLAYDRLGAERDSDLEVLCPLPPPRAPRRHNGM
jgi:hypothetical protein